MKLEQVVKILRVALVAVLFMFAFEVVFAIPGVTSSISAFVQGIETKWILWLAIWLIMFIQVCLVPIPAYVVINTAIQASIIDPTLGVISMFGSANTWIFIGVVMCAYMLGAVVAYLIGRRWGRIAVKWCAGSDEEYDKWSGILSQKGKWFYAGTIVLPIFPDDLLCIVAGSVKLNFPFFFWVNVIGRGIGLICMLAFLKGISGGGLLTLVGWGIALLIIVVFERIATCKAKKENAILVGNNNKPLGESKENEEINITTDLLSTSQKDEK